MTGNMEYIYNMEGVIDKLNMREFKRKTRFILSLVYQQELHLLRKVFIASHQLKLKNSEIS
jgi:hypothetical protein